MKTILVVDDNSNDAELVITALRETCSSAAIEVVQDGAEALDYLFRRGIYAQRTGTPDVVLLDIKMPKVDGLEVLRKVKADPVLRLVPVVMLTSSQEDRDVVQSYQHNANGYVVKPVDFTEFISAVQGLGEFWGIINVSPNLRNAP
ncbi:MAG TPA: response regulator [Methylomirabilota bacterium]|nr:response regulator [Methylomirabilota bacterium]